MSRRLALAAAIALSCAPALAAGEEDRRACAAAGQPESRIAACTRILADQSAAPALRTMAFRNRGTAYANKRMHELAILDFDEALKLTPEESGALVGRARALGHRGQHDRAIADYTQVLRLTPRNDRVINERGLIYLRKGDMAMALADFEAALLANPRNVYAHNNRAFLFAKQNRLDEAIAGYDKTLSIDPDYLLAYANRARAWEAKGEIEQALADFKRAAEGKLVPRHEDSARVQGSSRQAIARLTKAVAEGKIGPRAERRVALIIGNSAYARVPALVNPANDARKLAMALRTLGFTEVREVLNASLSDFGKALKEFGDLAAGADWAVIYFAGHGIELGGTNYLIPVDAALEQQAHVEDEAVPLPRVLSKVAGASKMQLVILDACRNNPFVPKMRVAGRQARAIGRGLASIEPESGVLVAYAARDGTTALDGDGENSPYAEALAKYLPESGLEISLLFRKVRDEVLSRTGRQQEPYTYGSLPAQPFYFKR